MLIKDDRTLFDTNTKKGAGDLQVKKPRTRFTAASRQPVTSDPPPVNNAHTHVSGSEHRQTVVLAGRVPPETDLAYEKLAKQRGPKWTKSKLAALALQEWLAQDMGESFVQRIISALTTTVHYVFKPYENRLAKLILEVLYEVREIKLWFYEWFRAAMTPEEFQKLKQDFWKKARQL